MKEETIEIGKLYDNLLKSGYKIIVKGDYEIITPDNIEILTNGPKYTKLVAVSRHKTIKHLIRLIIKCNENIYREIKITTDHVCMIFNKNNFFENIDAKNLEIGDYVKLYNKEEDVELIGTINDIEDLGTTDDYVYDCEVEDDLHSFYANDILIHNSQFISIRNITEKMMEEKNLPKNLIDWNDESKLELWKNMTELVDGTINKFVRDLAVRWCHTEHPEVLTYDLEYIGDTGLYESKKHYGVRKIIVEGPEIVDKIKYSGIELKKASIPKEVKTFLADIYSGVITKNWNEQDFRNYVNDAYDKICKMDIEQLAFWKGYGTEREAEGFLQMKKGVTSISASCTYYNQLLERLGIGSKYDSILIGDKVRFCYIDPNNKYGIKYIAFKDGQYPDEFRKIFKLDYPVMFDKLVLSPLKNFIKACGYSENIDPNNQNLMCIDDL